jgi:probable phosphoglycerate mutase
MGEPKMNTTFLLVRHGSCDSIGKKLNGRTPDVKLDQEGQVQAKQLAEKLSRLPIRAIYSSPMDRARETASPLSWKMDLPIRISPAFDEIDFGDWTGLSFQDLCQIPEWNHFNTFRSGTRIPGGEMISEVQARATQGLETLYQEHWGQTVAIFSHADVIRNVVAYYLGMPIDFFMRLEISPASVTTLVLSEYGPKLLGLNEHLST